VEEFRAMLRLHVTLILIKARYFLRRDGNFNIYRRENNVRFSYLIW